MNNYKTYKPYQQLVKCQNQINQWISMMQLENMIYIVITREVLKLDKSIEFNDEQPENIPYIL